MLVIPRKSDNVAFARRPRPVKACFPQELWCYIPALTVVRDDADRLFVVARDHTCHRWTPVRMKRHALADAELQHARVGVHLSQKPQPGHDTVIEVNECGLAQLIDIDRHGENSAPLRRDVFFERLVHTSLPTSPSSAKELQNLIRYPHRGLGLLSRAGRTTAPYQLLAATQVGTSGPRGSNFRGIVRITPSAARAS
jgi:hypothetical protein